MTEYPRGSFNREPHQDDPLAEPRARGVSWERRLSEARERRQEVIAQRESKAKRAASAAKTGAVRDLASVLRGDAAAEADAERARAAEHPTASGGTGGISPDRLAEARRQREEVIAARDGGADTALPPASFDPAPVTSAPTAATPVVTGANPAIFHGVHHTHPHSDQFAGGVATDLTNQALYGASDTIVPLPPRRRRKSRLLLWALIASLGFGAFALYQTRPDLVSTVLSRVSPKPVPSATVPGAGPEVWGASPNAPETLDVQTSALAIGSHPPFWSPNGRRAVLPLVATTRSATPVQADLAPPVPLDEAKATVFDALGGSAFVSNFATASEAGDLRREP